MATGNLIWSAPDRARAQEQNIHTLEERELRYFEEIARSIGPAARYQFLAEFLKEQQVPALSGYGVPAIRTKLGGNWAYFFVAPPSRILPISFVNHRGLRDLEGAPAYQRILKRSRLKQIGAYLDVGGFFPNSILVNFRKPVRFERQTSMEDRMIAFGTLYLPDTFKSMWIIDGQHRLFGYTEMNSDMDGQPLPILAFDQLPTLSEAELFTIINSKQQKVSVGLLDELAGELKVNSGDFDERAGAIASRALDFLGSESGGPLEDRIKTADLAESEQACLTISQIKSAITSTKLLGSVGRNGVVTPGPFTRRNTKDTVNALCDGLSSYFAMLQQANSERWDAGKSGHLCTNIALQGYLRLFASLLEFMRTETGQEPNSLDPDDLIDQIKPYLAPVMEFVETAEDADFAKRFKQPFGSGGPPRYYYQLCLLVRSQFPKFKPPGFEETATVLSAELTEQADALNKSVVDRVHKHVVTVLKAKYGAEHFFNKGIPQKEIKMSAMNKVYEEENEPLPPETYLDVIQLKKIVEHRQNWELFKETLNIKLPAEKKGNAQYLRWLERLNEVRRIPAHPYGRTYKEEDIEFLEYVSRELEARRV